MVHIPRALASSSRIPPAVSIGAGHFPIYEARRTGQVYLEFEDSEYSDYDGLAVETTYYTNGQVWTNIWSRFEGKGKYTGNEVSFPFHISYLWKGDKIIEEVQFFSTKVFDAENEAKNNQLK